VTHLREARLGVTAIFFVFGAVGATWASRIPLIKEELGLDSAELSLALLAAPVGLIFVVQIVSGLVHRWTSAAVTRWAAIGTCATLVLLAVAWDLASLTVALLLFGMACGALDTAMNGQAVAIERGYRRPIMAAIHAMFSVGLLIGGAIGAVAAHADLDPLVHFALAGAVLAALGYGAGLPLLGAEADAIAEPDHSAPPTRLSSHPFLVAVGIIAMCAFLSEGAVDNWSAVYLHESLGASFGLAPLGAAACGAAMGAARFGGDAVIARFGRRTTLWWTALLAAAGMVLAVLAPGPGVAIAGFAVFGLGVAAIVPIAFTLGGNVPGVPPIWAISRITTLAYVGLLSGPPAIGFVAQATSLELALCIPVALMAVVAALSRVAPHDAEGRARQVAPQEAQ
jgi:fucose permease